MTTDTTADYQWQFNEPADLEDFLSDTISDSFDMDWTSRDGARAIVREMEKEGLVLVRKALPMSEVKELVELLKTTWPQDAKFGPVTARQRAIIHQAADTLQSQERRIGELTRALEPFAGLFVSTFVDDDGWKMPMRRERIVDWFGPSDFRLARRALTGAP